MCLRYLKQTLILRNHHIFSWTLTYFSISGAQWTKSCFQKLYVGFLMRSINVINRPQGCGLFTISLSSNTLQKRNKIKKLLMITNDICYCIVELYTQNRLMEALHILMTIYLHKNSIINT